MRFVRAAHLFWMILEYPLRGAEALVAAYPAAMLLRQPPRQLNGIPFHYGVHVKGRLSWQEITHETAYGVEHVAHVGGGLPPRCAAVAADLSGGGSQLLSPEFPVRIEVGAARVMVNDLHLRMGPHAFERDGALRVHQQSTGDASRRRVSLASTKGNTSSTRLPASRRRLALQGLQPSQSPSGYLPAISLTSTPSSCYVSQDC